MDYVSFAEYLWLDGAKPSQQIRSKSRVLRLPRSPKVNDFSDCRFDGSATGQADGNDSECILRPVRVYRDPFRGDDNHIVLCEVKDSGGNTHESNQRALLRAAIKAAGEDLAPWLGCEQKYTLVRNGRALDCPDNSNPSFAGAHYCGVGCENVFGRDVAEAHAKACMTAGILLGGINAGGAPGQWEFQIGYPGIEGEACDALAVADDLWLARYLLNRVGEQFGIHVSFGSKVINGVCNGASLLTHFSTAYTRDPRCGLTAIQAIVRALESGLYDNVADCPADQSSGKQESAKVDAFEDDCTYGDGAIHIPWRVARRGYGYLEDRRAGTNADPYQVGIGLMSAISGKTIRDATYCAANA